MTSIIDTFNQSQVDQAFAETLKRMLINKRLSPQEKTHAYLLGGQSGAGKSALHRILGSHLEGNVVVVNGDEYRKSHPHFDAIQEQYGVDAPSHTAKWAGQITEALVDAFSTQSYNLIIEGTLRTSEVPLSTATLLRKRGYSVSLALMAVKPEISLISCQIRYEMMRIAGTTPRATDPEHHNMIVHDIVNNLGTLEASGLFDEILIYNRAGRLLFPTEGSSSAVAVLENVLFGPWTSEEETHYQRLKQRLDELKQQ